MALEEIGRYRITETIGENPQGTIYRGFDPFLKRAATLHTCQVDRDQRDDENSRDRLIAGIKSAERLSHPAIATVYDSGLEGDYAYIATELPEGRTLDQLLVDERPLPAELAADIAVSLADALAYSHRRGVLHLDIAPKHITILPNGKAKLSGFGLAALAQLRHSADPLHETVSYLAPEQFSGKTLDTRTDLFSLATVFYQLLTGKEPFQGENTAEVMYRIVNKPARRPSRVVHLAHQGFDVVLARALAKSPENRYANASDLANDLRHAAELTAQEPADWPVGGLAPRRTASRQRHRAKSFDETSAPTTRPARRGPVFATALVLGIAALLAGVTSWRGEEAPQRSETASESMASTKEPAGETDTLATTQATTPHPTAQNVPPERLVTALAESPETELEKPPAGTAPLPSPPESAPVAETPPAVTVSLSIAPWGEIFINGQRKGISPPLTRLELPPGVIRVEVRNTGAPPFVKVFRLDEGQKVTVKHKF